MAMVKKAKKADKAKAKGKEENLPPWLKKGFKAKSKGGKSPKSAKKSGVIAKE